MISSPSKKALIGAKVFTGDKFQTERAVLLDAGVIKSVVPEKDIPEEYCKQTLAGGMLVPGFIDVQVNGGGGVLFNDSPTLEALQAIMQAHRRYGTTGMLPTLISDSLEKMKLAWSVSQTALQDKMPGILGLHLEGPYLNILRKGVHDEETIRQIEEDIFSLMSSDRLGENILTLAPEMLPAGMMKRLKSHAVRVCAGHTASTYEDIKSALKDGLAGFTHLFNAMTPMESRAPGVVGAALEDPSSYCGIIVDGHHIHPATLKVAIAAKATGRMILVTDAMPSVGATNKAFTLGDEDIIVKNGRCVTQNGVLAGSDLDMINAVKNCVEMLDLPLEEALRMASLYPAAFLNLDGELGRISNEYRADMVHLSDDLTVLETWIGGDSQKH